VFQSPQAAFDTGKPLIELHDDADCDKDDGEKSYPQRDGFRTSP
jgi:hypothetical protein